MLDIYEITTTYRNSDKLATVDTVYLKNRFSASWWTPHAYSTDGITILMGPPNNTGTGYHMGMFADVRPSMYLKSTVKISSTNTGDGTYERPYEIEI